MMSDPLANRIAGNQIRMAAEELKRDAARLSRNAAQYSAALEAGEGADSGTARRLAQDAADLARCAERLDAMRTIADLYRDEE